MLKYLVLLLLAGCGRPPPYDSSHGTSLTLTAISRHVIGTITLTLWDDVVVSEAGVELGEDGVCRFINPTRHDESTRWTPFQVYWVIFGETSDVRNGTSLAGFFGAHDVVKADRIKNLSGQTAVGFAYVNPEMYRVIDISPGQILEDGAGLETILNIMGRKAIVRARAFIRDGTCAVTSTVCNGGIDCSAPGAFVKLGNFRVTQTMLGLPREVAIDPEPSLRWL